MNDAMKKVLILIGKVTVTMIFVLVLIFQIDWHEVWSYVTQMHMGYVTLFGLLYIFGIGISAWKWSLLARHIHFVRPYSFYIKTYLLELMFYYIVHINFKNYLNNLNQYLA